MRTRSIHAGDLVQVSKRGRLFYAKVTAVGVDGQLQLAPLERNVSYHHATAREVVDHWAHATPKPARDEVGEGQMVLGPVLES